MNKRQLISKIGLTAVLLIDGRMLPGAPAAAAPSATWESVRAAYELARDRAETAEVDRHWTWPTASGGAPGRWPRHDLPWITRRDARPCLLDALEEARHAERGHQPDG